MPSREVKPQHVAYVGLGSNMGDRQATLSHALGELGAHPDVRVLAASSFFETEPVGGPPQGPFLNAAAAICTALSPQDLLGVLHVVESMFSRERGIRWGPRTLDLDLLLYEDEVIHEPGLDLPHPRMHLRRFVLEPLCQIAPDAVHPCMGRSVRSLLSDLQA
jgi:2-amino-4-hydroxy-6-hydroxymethyldihydropteridine diphosphokinase